MFNDFNKLLGARFFFTFGVQMQAVVLGWRIYELLEDPLALGFVGLAEAIPAIGFALFAGFVVDRSKPLKVYRSVIYISFISAVVVLAEHFLQNSMSVFWQAGLLYFAAILTGVGRAFAAPAIFASVPRMVERKNLLSATAKMSTAMQVARVAGPAAGGLLYGFFGAEVSSSVVCISLLISMTALFLIRIKILPVNSKKIETKIQELFSGARFVFAHPILFPALSLDMICVFFGGVTALLPIFAKEVLHVGPQGLGLLRAGPAIGAAIMALYLSKNPEKFRKGQAFLLSIVGFGFSILIFGVSQNFYLSLLALVLSGVFDSISMLIRSAAVQLSSPDSMRGKISSVNSIFIGSSNEIGEFESGLAAKILGPVPAVYFGGIMCLLTVGIVSYFSPALRQLDLKKLESLN